jgi:Transglutaminase-like superfamily
MAARFVSGYLHVPDRDDDGNAGGGNTHAWVQVYLPGPGWVDFDPASPLIDWLLLETFALIMSRNIEAYF